MIKKLTVVGLCILLIFCFSAVSFAENTAKAADLSKNARISGSGYNNFTFLTDRNQSRYYISAENTSINIESDIEIASLYMVFGKVYGEYSLTDCEGEKTVTVGKNDFMHEYIDVVSLFGKPLKNITITFGAKKVRLSEIFMFSSGELPEFVQKWNLPEDGKADLMLFSAHGDDDQLYFAGLLPHYAVDKGYNVQVVYMTDHQISSDPRMHEMLNGLWAVGIRNYPIFGNFKDFRIDDKEKTYKRYEELGSSYDELLGFVTEQIRRYKPLVTVGHDFKGEYGHGMHMVYADLVSKAIISANDSSAFPETAQKYGTWQVQKAYFHLYEDNPIILDFDTPRECFGGLSAFQMTQKYGFPCHESQQKYDFKDWLNGKNGQITKVTQIKSYNPAHYGLFYTAVGDDINKNDMFENVSLRQEKEIEEILTELPSETLQQDLPPENAENQKSSLLLVVVLFAVVLTIVCAVLIKIKKAES